jgi:hypothetical protein
VPPALDSEEAYTSNDENDILATLKDKCLRNLMDEALTTEK